MTCFSLFTSSKSFWVTLIPLFPPTPSAHILLIHVAPIYLLCGLKWSSTPAYSSDLSEFMCRTLIKICFKTIFRLLFEMHISLSPLKHTHRHTNGWKHPQNSSCPMAVKTVCSYVYSCCAGNGVASNEPLVF